MSNRVGGSHIGGAATREESAIWIPRGGAGGAGQYGEAFTNRDLTFAILREPVAHRVVATVAKDVFDNWFELELEDAKEQENKEFNRIVQAELRKLRAKRELTVMSVMERGYGYGIIVLGFQDDGKSLEDPVENPSRIVQIKAYGEPQITKVTVDKKEKINGENNAHFGLPEIYFIQLKGVTKRLRVHYTRVIHFATRHYDPNKEQWRGGTVLSPIWDDLVTLRNERYNMGQTMVRYGSGFPVFTFNEATKAQIQGWVDAGLFGDVSGRTYFACNEKQSIKFEGLAGRSLDPMNYYLPVMESISAGSGIPLAILRGVQAGALTGSEVNQMEYYGIISDEQSAYESGMRKLIDLIRLFAMKRDKAVVKKVGSAKLEKAINALVSSGIGFGVDVAEMPETSDLPGFNFNWKGGFELDEKKKQEISLLEAQELQIRGQWHTRNELRKMEDPEVADLSEDQGGNELLGVQAEPEETAFNPPPIGIETGGSSFLVQEVPKKRPKDT